MNDLALQLITTNDYSVGKSRRKKSFNYWTVLIYPDAVYDNWKELLFNYVMSVPKGTFEIALSPLHTPSNNPTADFEDESKLHYHLIVYFGSAMKPYEVQWIFDNLYIEHAPQVAAVRDPSAMYKYLCHYGIFTKEQFAASLDSIFTSSNYPIPAVVSANLTFAHQLRYLIDNKIYSAAQLIMLNTPESNYIVHQLNNNKLLYSAWQDWVYQVKKKDKE